MIAATNLVGTIPTWILVAMAIVVAWRVTKGGAGSAVSELAKANEVLDKRVQQLGAEVRDTKIENARLRERTDVSLAIVPVIEALAAHETRAGERHTAQLGILALIADRLGTEANGHEVTA